MTQEVYTTGQVEQWGEKLQELAQKPRTSFSKKEVVESLLEPIAIALVNHSYEEVAHHLTEWGLEISAGSLKQYVTRLQRERSGQRQGKGESKRKSSEKQAIGLGDSQKGNERDEQRNVVAMKQQSRESKRESKSIAIPDQKSQLLPEPKDIEIKLAY